jgi:exonuclease SbcC
MIKELRLSNYRQHVDKVIQFQPGINAILAANEAGKSSVLEAIGYAFFGASALGAPLERVVTWDTPLSKLRVEMDFEHLGVAYSLYRAKSGAELVFGGGRVTGQKEVTKYIESLFGASSSMAEKLMIASQKNLTAALDDGPTAAGKMLATLTDLDLINRVIELVQEQLPCGDTSAAAARMALLEQQAGAQVDTDFGPLAAEVQRAEGAVQRLQGDHDKWKAELANLNVPLAHEILGKVQQIEGRAAPRLAEIARLEGLLAEKLPSAPDAAEIERVRAAVAQEKNVASALALKAELMRLPEPGQWDEPLATLETEIAGQRALYTQYDAIWKETGEAARAVDSKLTQARSAYQLAAQKLEGQMIRESACGLCGKDLTDVPEVVARNAELQRQLDTLASKWQTTEKELKDEWGTHNSDAFEAQKMVTQTKDYLGQLEAVLAAGAKCDLLYARAEAYITLDRGMVPAKWTWTGPEAGGVSLAPKLAELEADAKKATEDAARRAQQVEQLDALKAAGAADASALAALPVADAKETLDLQAQYTAEVNKVVPLLQTAQQGLHNATAALSQAKAVAAEAQKQVELAKSMLEKTKLELAEIEANNLLVKKLRNARPVITDKIWNMTLGAVSRYLPQVRGVESVVSRGEEGFIVNGRPADDYSGSAKDALGLAIRAGLTRTFLPTMPLMILDEPAAACSVERETRMLGMLRTLDFGQVLLVTHSDLCDSFADHIINL